MEWLLDNLKLVVFVIIIVVYALKAMRDKAEADKPPGPGTSPADESAEAERTRQIQEEIRRRILARQRGEAPPASPPPVIIEEREEPEPVLTPRPVALPPPVPAEVHEPAFEPVDDTRQRDAAILEAQRALEEQLRLVRAAREAASGGVPSIAVPGAAPAGTQRSVAARRRLRADLAGRGSLRRAIVLREILGEPVGLRSGPAGLTRR